MSTRLRRAAASRRTLIVGAAALLTAMVLAGAALAAGGETPVTVKVGNLELTANGGFSPTALSKTKQTPIELKAAGEVKEADGSHPPAVREVIIEGDKNAEVHVKGIPTCKSGQLQAAMSGMSLPDYSQMMLDGGRPPEGIRSKKEQRVG